MPEWLVAALRGAAPRTEEPSEFAGPEPVKPRGLAAVPEVIRGPCGSGQDREPGERHDVLMRYACSLRARSVPLDEAEHLYRAAWERCEQPPACDTPLTWKDARSKLKDVYDRYEAGPSGPDEAEADPGDTAVVTTRTSRREADRIHSHHSRLAYRLAAEYAARLMYVPHVGWHWWDGARWAEDAEGGHARLATLAVIRAGKVEAWQATADAEASDNAKAAARAGALLKDAQRCESGSGVNGVVSLAQALLTVPHTDLDADPHALNTPAGTLDLRTGELRPHSPTDRITKCTSGKPGAPGGEWQAFLERVLPDDDVRGFVQRLAGHALLGCVREHVLPLLVGVGANGKSTFYGALLESLGDYAGMAEPDLLLVRERGTHPTREMDLRGKRLVVTTESEAERRMAEATVKRLTGGDPITARRMYRDFVTFAPSHTLMMVTNFPPTVAGDDSAVWRRLVVVPFTVVIPEPEQDERLPERLRLCADEIVSWAVAGWRCNVERGLDPPERVRLATSEYRTDNDSVARWLADDESVQVNAQLACTTRAAFERFCRWHDSRDVGERAFGKALDRLGYPARKGTAGVRYRHGFGLVEPPS